MAIASRAAQSRSERAAGDQPARTGQTTALDREAAEEKGRARGRAGPALISPEELASRPTPKVVDTTALPTEPSRRKPSLAEIARRKDRHRRPALTSREWDSDNYTVPGLDLLDAHDPEGRGGSRSGGIGTGSANLDRHARRNLGSRSRRGRHHQRADDHALRSLSGQRRARGQDRESGTRPRPRHPRRADQHSRADSRQGHGRHRAGEHRARSQ